MSFIIFMILFTVVCGWMDTKARLNHPKGAK